MAFTSVACLLWLVSSSGQTSVLWQRLFQLVTPLIAIPMAIGTLLAFRAIAETPQDLRPRFLPILVLSLVGWVISYASSSHGGASPMVDWLIHVTGFDRATAGSIVVLARKTTHFCFYGFVAFVGLKLAIRNGATLKIALATGLLAALSFAAFDEARQSNEPDRGGSAWDVMLDMSGATAAMVVAGSLLRRKSADGPMHGKNSSTL
jgi:VanZ family protein